MQGISTRSVDDLVKAMGMEGISKRQVRRLCGKIDEKVQGLLNRLLEGDWPYIWIDATCIGACRLQLHPYPAARKWLQHSWLVKGWQTRPTCLQRSWYLRAAALRIRVFSGQSAISIGFRSGE